MLLLQIGDKPFRRAGDGDELAIRGVHRTQVQTEGDAMAYLAHSPYDAVFIDLDVLAACAPRIISAIREAKLPIPIFAFTTSLDTRVKISLLDLGADDVLTNLCPIDELLARVRAVMRRLDGHTTSTILFGPLEVMMDAREVKVRGERLRLSPTEYLLIEFLVRRHGAPVTKAACLSYLYAGRDEPNLKMIDVLVCRIRKKLEKAGAANLIQNVWGHGYRLEAGAPPGPYDGIGGRSADVAATTSPRAANAVAAS
jgi:two-component system cell cycle response regulator CtrA